MPDLCPILEESNAGGPTNYTATTSGLQLSSWQEREKEGSRPFFIDFRTVIYVIIKGAFSLPRIDGILESLYGVQWFCSLNLKAGYWQIPLMEEDKTKIVFKASSGHLCESEILPFELYNSPAIFS